MICLKRKSSYEKDKMTCLKRKSSYEKGKTTCFINRSSYEKEPILRQKAQVFPEKASHKDAKIREEPCANPLRLDARWTSCLRVKPYSALFAPVI
jgi:hypothetical protein